MLMKSIDTLHVSAVGPDNIQPGRTFEISAEQLAENKIIILGDFDAAALDAGKCRVIADFVEKGGSLVLLGGSRLWGAQGIAATPLARISAGGVTKGEAKAKAVGGTLAGGKAWSRLSSAPRVTCR